MLASDHISPLATEKEFNKCKKLFITGGEKKSDALIHNGFPFIGLSGFYGLKDKRIGECKLILELEEFN